MASSLPLESTVEYSPFFSMPSIAERDCRCSSTTRTRAGLLCCHFSLRNRFPGIRFLSSYREC